MWDVARLGGGGSGRCGEAGSSAKGQPGGGYDLISAAVWCLVQICVASSFVSSLPDARHKRQWLPLRLICVDFVLYT